MVDILATLTFYLEVINNHLMDNWISRASLQPVANVLQFLSIVRIMRLLKVGLNFVKAGKLRAAGAPLVRTEDPRPDVQGVGQGAAAARLLRLHGHHNPCFADLLRRTDGGGLKLPFAKCSGQPVERVRVDPGRPVVGTGHDLHRRLRGHGAQDESG